MLAPYKGKLQVADNSMSPKRAAGNSDRRFVKYCLIAYGC